MSKEEQWVKEQIFNTVFVGFDENGNFNESAYDKVFLEAYMCCVAMATDDRGLRLALKQPIGEAAVISRSLLKNLSNYGYKITKE